MNKIIKNASKAMFVVDVNKGFLVKGNMASPSSQHIIPVCKRIIEKFLAEEEVVVYVNDWHTDETVEFLDFPEHNKAGSEEAEMVDELLPYQDRVINIHKNATSAIFAKGFIELLEKMENVKEVVVIGCCTDICVFNLAISLKSYFDENNRKIKIIVPKNAVETFDSPAHSRNEYNEIAFKLLTQAGINVVDSY